MAGTTLVSILEGSTLLSTQVLKCGLGSISGTWLTRSGLITLNMITSVSSRRCESCRMYLKGDSPHQAVMISCELK